jgi:hypothetical protein
VKRWDLVVTLGIVAAVGVASLTAFTSVTACNSGNTTCPDKTAVVAGGACSDENLQCAYDLSTPAVACDGTSAIIETSCTCTDGTWACPSAVECDAGAADPGEAGDEAGDEAAAGDGGDEASPDEDAADAADAHD